MANKQRAEMLQGCFVARDVRDGKDCRGWYVCQGRGLNYMRHAGSFTFGIQGPANWWRTKAEASRALRAAIKKAL